MAPEPVHPQLMAVFRSQAWVHDQALDIDHPIRFDATAKILRLSAEEIRNFKHNNYDSDTLAEDLPVRKDHTEPFEIDTDLDAWLEAYGVAGREKLPDERWEEIRQLCGPQPATREVE